MKETLAELYESRFDMMQTDFENQLSLLEHLTTTYENGLDDIEERGYLGGAQYYEALKNVEQQNIDIMKQELADLTQAMSDAVNSGYVEVGSESWHSMQQEINGVKESIQEAEMAMVEYNNAMREMKWEIFDYMQERIGKVAEEAGFLIDLMSNDKLYEDNGQLTDEGMATMGLHGANYNTYMEQADRYAEELLELDKELANDPYNTKLIERREELLEAQQDAIAGAESEKDAIKDMVEEGISKELDALQKLIDKRKEDMDAAKDLYEYQKKIKEQTKEIASLEKQRAAYANDDSEENRARLQQLNVSLEEARDELYESEYDRYISDQSTMLDDLFTEYEETLNKRLDNLDALVSDMIDRINANATSIEDTLNTVTDKVGYTMSETMHDIWDGEGSLGGIISTYGDNFLGSMTSLNEALGRIEAYVASMSSSGDTLASGTVGSAGSQTPANPNPGPNTPNVPGNSVQDEPIRYKDMIKVISEHTGINTKADATGTRIGVADKGDMFEYLGVLKKDRYKILYNGQVGWIKKANTVLAPKTAGYSTGGIVGDPKKIAKRNGDNIVTINTLKKGEAILTPDQTKLFSKFVDYLPQAQEAMNAQRFMAKAPDTKGGNVVSIGDVSFNIPIDHVENYDDLVTKMQKDTQFEKLVQSMTVDRLAGKSPLAKHKYKWG